MAKNKTAKRKAAAADAKGKKKKAANNSLVGNINRRKQAGQSRSKKDSTIAPEAYTDMKAGWPKKKKANKKK